MRAAVLVLGFASTVLASCGPPSDGCEQDNDCASDAVCARTSICEPKANVRTVRISWTVGGQPANAARCSPFPDLYLLFAGYDAQDTFGYEPVPCAAGLFTIDKLPTRYIAVEIGDNRVLKQEKAIDSMDAVSFDLVP